MQRQLDQTFPNICCFQGLWFWPPIYIYIYIHIYIHTKTSVCNFRIAFLPKGGGFWVHLHVEVSRPEIFLACRGSWGSCPSDRSFDDPIPSAIARVQCHLWQKRGWNTAEDLLLWTITSSLNWVSQHQFLSYPRSGQPFGPAVRPFCQDGCDISSLEGEDRWLVGMDPCRKSWRSLKMFSW